MVNAVVNVVVIVAGIVGVGVGVGVGGARVVIVDVVATATVAKVVDVAIGGVAVFDIDFALVVVADVIDGVDVDVDVGVDSQRPIFKLIAGRTFCRKLIDLLSVSVQKVEDNNQSKFNSFDLPFVRIERS